MQNNSKRSATQMFEELNKLCNIFFSENEIEASVAYRMLSGLKDGMFNAAVFDVFEKTIKIKEKN